ncbi:MAG: type II secretion system major pseudopilin GspG [Phycisphaerales bacterium]
MNRKTQNAARGFTLLEVMIVIVIILAILGLVTVNLMGARDKANRGVVQMKLASLKGALEQFELDFNRLPLEEGEGLQALWNPDVIPEEERGKWRAGGYLKEPMPRDDWGSEWVYRVTTADDASGGEPTAAVSKFQLWSIGPDKQEGTSDDIYPGDRKPGDSTDSGDVGPPPAPTGG